MGSARPMIEYTPEIEAAANTLLDLVTTKDAESLTVQGDYKMVARRDIKGDPEIASAYDNLKALVKSQLRDQLEPIVILDD